MNEILLVMGSYASIIFMAFGILAWLQAGFLIPFLKVKTSRGKKILVKIRKKTGADFVAADIVENMLVFKYKKEKKRVGKFDEGIYRAYNVACVDIDGKTYGVVNPEFKGVATNDPDKTDSLIQRALMRPSKKSNMEILIIICLILLLLGVVFIGYKVNFLQQSLEALKSVGGANI